MDHANIIIRPLVTEKSTHQQGRFNAYAFQVHRHASKHQIKAAVEAIYEVKVKDVRTLNRKGKPRRTRYGELLTPAWKRAVVVLDENSHISTF